MPALFIKKLHDNDSRVELPLETVDGLSVKELKNAVAGKLSVPLESLCKNTRHACMTTPSNHYFS